MFKVILKKFLYSLFYVGFVFLILFIASNFLATLINALGKFGFILVLALIFLACLASFLLRRNNGEKRREYISHITEKKFNIGRESEEIFKSRDYISELIVCGIWLIPITLYAGKLSDISSIPVYIMFFLLLELCFALCDIVVRLCVRKYWSKDKI